MLLACGLQMATAKSFRSLNSKFLVSSITHDDQNIYIGTKNGLIVIDKETESQTLYNSTNSSLPAPLSPGDGYYYWGLGAKPSDCPSWVPDSPDGDDSDINYGVMDAYGYLEQLPAGVTVKTEVTYNSNQQDSQRYGIVNGGVLRITGHLTMTGSASIRVCEGGMLIVDGGTIQDADIQMIPGSTLIVRNNGKINMASNKTFYAPVGTLVNIENGEIN